MDAGAWHPFIEHHDLIPLGPPGPIPAHTGRMWWRFLKALKTGEHRVAPSTWVAATAAVVYAVSPIDLIPDAIPVIGMLDDALVVRFTLSAIQADLRTFCEWKGYDPALYFE